SRYLVYACRSSGGLSSESFLPQEISKQRFSKTPACAVRNQVSNPTPSGHQIGKPQFIVLCPATLISLQQPVTFLLTAKRLGVGCGQKWQKVVELVEVVGRSKTRGASGIQG